MTNEPTVRKPENPYAFPLPDDPGFYPAEHGMSLRDYFAAAALQGMLASGHQAPLEQLTVVQGGKPADGLALAAYGFADALLKVRQDV